MVKNAQDPEYIKLYYNNLQLMKKNITLFGLLLLCAICSAQQLTYKPKNPAFGGETFNYNWMLSSAEAQNTYEEPTSDESTESSSSTVDDFAESLNRQILSRLSRELISSQFGEDGLTEGSYVLGDYQIEIGDSDSGLSISIVDNVTGANTNVVVPYF